MKPPRLSPNARKFQTANRQSPVVSGELDHGITTRRLKDGRTFRLTGAEIKAIGRCRWDGDTGE